LTVGALWLSVISKIGIVGFVNVVGAIIAPFFGILVIDYYIIRRQNINMNDFFLSRQYSYRTWQNSKVTASY